MLTTTLCVTSKPVAYTNPQLSQFFVFGQSSSF